MRGLNRGTLGFLAILWLLVIGLGMVDGDVKGSAGFMLIVSALYLLLCVVAGWLIGLVRGPKPPNAS